MIKVINTVLGKLATLANAFKSLTELITGKKSSGQTDAAAAGLGMGDMQAAADDTNAVADATNNAADATGDLADAQNDNAAATKNARKEQERFLAGFDKITKASDSSSDDSSSPSGSGGGKAGKAGAGTGAGGAGLISPVNYGEVAKGESELEKTSGIFDKLIAKVKQLANIFKNGFLAGLGDFAPRLKNIQKNVESIGQSLIDIFTDPKVIRAASRYAKRVSYSLGQITGSVASIGITLGQLITGGIAKFLEQSKERIKQHLINMFDIRSDIWKMAGDWAESFARIFESFGGENAQGLLGNVLSIFYEAGALVQETLGKLFRDALNMITKPFIDNEAVISEALDGTLGVLNTFSAGILTVVQTISDAFSGFYDAHLKPLFDALTEGLSGILNTLFTGYNTYVLPVLQGLAERFTELMEGPFGQAIRNILAFLGDIADAVTFLWTTVLQPVAEFLAGVFMTALSVVASYLGEAILTALTNVSTFINDVFKPAWDALRSFFAETFGPVLETLGGLFNTLKTEYLEKIAPYITETFQAAWEGLSTFWTETFAGACATISAVLGAFFNEVVKPLGQFIAQAMLDAWTKLKDYWTNDLSPKLAALHEAFKKFKDNVLSPMAKTVRNTLLQAWEKISAFFAGDANDSTTTLAGTFKFLWENVLKPVATFVNGTLTTAFTLLKTVLSGLITFLTNVFTGNWEGAWNTVVETFGGVWGAIVDYVKTPINAAIGLVNDMINWINSRMNDIANVVQIPAFEIDLPGPLGTLGFSGWRLWDTPPQLGTIPLLAKGAVIPPNAPFAAVLGDQKRGTNIEAPLDTIKQALAEVLADIRAGENRSEGVKTINLLLDGRVISEVVVDDINRQINSTGIVPINI